MSKVTEVGRSIYEVFIMMKMLKMQVGQLAGQPMGDKEEFPRQPQGPEMAKATQTHSGEMEDHTKETMKITTEGPEFETPSHFVKEVVASSRPKDKASL
jgi:purine nucleoside phosphorylase